MTEWLRVQRGDAPLIVSIPHAGSELVPALEARLLSPWLARKDADWWVDRLYAFAQPLGATLLGTALSRSVIDVNRDPEGRSLYPGQATTELCPTTTFDGEPLYRPGMAPDAAEILERRTTWYAPYHTALASEITRLRARHPRIVLYDAHSIRSRIPRLFAGELPHFNVGTNSGASCAQALADDVAAACAQSGDRVVVNGRFKGGHITRHYGQPAEGVHAIQLELACRTYLDEPSVITPESWPAAFADERAARARDILESVLKACLRFAGRSEERRA
jgi:N-formylglutamate deformylase